MKLLTPAKDGVLVLDFDDVVQRSMTVVRAGEKTWPPPPVAVSVAPAPPASPPAAAASVGPGTRRESAARRYALVMALAIVLFALTVFAPSQLIINVTVLVLAVVVGYYVIGSVHHALHTPLMSVTNAISGIIVVGAMLQIGRADRTTTVLSFVAILLVSINIFGGFAVTRRMLSMFTKS
jgi:NAD(P) transhydrogenase subunit alpha